ncbi:MAG: hypothetical protein IKY14_05965, partial [Erysipelotrichaceae bacterium]|nr:hypothetical protein [Erysipelotrichaceae bacterium]
RESVELMDREYYAMRLMTDALGEKDLPDDIENVKINAANRALTKEEKISLIVNMFSVGPSIFLSILGMLWGIVPGSPDTSFGEILYDMTLMMSGAYFLVAGAAVILSLVFRKSGKTKASIWVNVIAFLYIAAVLAINSFASKVL